MNKRRKKRIVRQRPMPGQLFHLWRKTKKGWSQRKTSKELGMSRGFLESCEREGAPLYIALATIALDNIEPAFLKRRLKAYEIEIEPEVAP